MTRNGAAVAVISPRKSTSVTAERFRGLIATAPEPDTGFLDDIRAARGCVPPPEDAWPS